MAIDEECGMGLILGEASGEESIFFCPGTESRLSDETPSEALALDKLQNYELYYYYHYTNVVE